MSAVVHLSEYAVSDLASIGDYIEYQLSSPQAANKTLTTIIDAIQMLGEFPESGVAITAMGDLVTPYRVFICEKRYAISYVYDKSSQSVWVYRVFHTIQDWLAVLIKQGSDTKEEQE